MVILASVDALLNGDENGVVVCRGNFVRIGMLLFGAFSCTTYVQSVTSDSISMAQVQLICT